MEIPKYEMAQIGMNDTEGPERRCLTFTNEDEAALFLPSAVDDQIYKQHIPHIKPFPYASA